MYKVIGVDNQVYGPVDAEQIRQWIRERRLATQSQLQKEGESTWQPLSAFPEFADLLAVAAPAVVPQAAYSSAPSTPTTHTNGMAVGGFVCGLLSFCCTCFPLGLVGLILCIIALSQISKQPMQAGKGWAIAGIILSVLGFATTVIFFAFNLFGDLLKDLNLE
jgi:hypothetical protein